MADMATFICATSFVLAVNPGNPSPIRLDLGTVLTNLSACKLTRKNAVRVYLCLSLKQVPVGGRQTAFFAIPRFSSTIQVQKLFS